MGERDRVYEVGCCVGRVDHEDKFIVFFSVKIYELF